MNPAIREAIEKADAAITKLAVHSGMGAAVSWKAVEMSKNEASAAIRNLACVVLEEAAYKVHHILREGGGNYGDEIRALMPEEVKQT